LFASLSIIANYHLPLSGAIHGKMSMSEVIEEIENAIAKLKLEKDVIRLDDGEVKTVYLDLLATFVEGGDRRWWWESFKLPSRSKGYEDGKGFERLTKMVPDSKEKLWFIAEDVQLPYFPIFEASAEDVVKIIGECFAYEYYLVPKHKRWLLCENHHDNIIGVGDEVLSSF
jgi:hypothetical protein